MTTIQDRLSAGGDLAWKAPVRAASTANLTLSGTQTVDTISLVEGDRVLVKNQNTGSENGIYIVKSGVWQRSPDWDGNNDVVTGTMVFVTAGSTNAKRLYYVSTTGAIVVGTTSVAFTLGTTLS